jgi:hypothetical protein
MVGIEMRGEADGDILDLVMDPAPLAVEIDDSESAVTKTVMRIVTVTREEGKDDGRCRAV